MLPFSRLEYSDTEFMNLKSSSFPQMRPQITKRDLFSAENAIKRDKRDKHDKNP